MDASVIEKMVIFFWKMFFFKFNFQDEGYLYSNY